MGCASSKQVDTAEDVYQPPPASVAYFDISTIGEPWLVATKDADDGNDQDIKKPTALPLPLLEKVEGYELAPKSWSEVSKALEDLKPSLLQNPTATSTEKLEPATTPPSQTPVTPVKKPSPAPALPSPGKKKPQSIHTVEDLDAKDTPRSNSRRPGDPALPLPSPAPPRSPSQLPAALPEGLRPVSRNSFILRDKQEREKNANASALTETIRRLRRSPLDGLPEACPPGGASSVVLYTTTVRAVRRTFEDCEAVRQAVDAHLLAMGGEIGLDERDVSLHSEFLKELRELVGEDGHSVPRLFVLGRYVGGAAEILEFNETGKLADMLRLVARKAKGESVNGGSRRGCGGCGGARFVPCLTCGGSCKVVAEDGKGNARCGECNENGLVLCPLCN